MRKLKPCTQLLEAKHSKSNYANFQTGTKHALKFFLIGFAVTSIFMTRCGQKWHSERCCLSLASNILD